MNKRFGFERKIENIGVAQYRWTISRDGKQVASNVECCVPDCERVMRSTIKFLNERGNR